MKSSEVKVEPCIRDREGRICAWLTGMSDEDEFEFLKNNAGTYCSVEIIELGGEK